MWRIFLIVILIIPPFIVFMVHCGRDILAVARLKWHNLHFHVFSFENVLELGSCASTAIMPRREHSFNDYMKRFLEHIAAVILRIM